MGPLIVAAIFAVGYLYCYLDPVWQYRINRSEGYKLYFVVGLVGSFIFLFTLVFVLLLDHLNISSLILDGTGVSIKEVQNLAGTGKQDFKYYTTLPLSFLIALLVGGLRKVLFLFQPTKRNKMLRNFSKANALESLLFEATLAYKPVTISLENNKVYVGLVQEFTPESGHLQYLQIIPILSGYRDDAHKIQFTTNYYQHYEDFFDENTGEYKLNPDRKLEDFLIVLPVDKIQSLSHFDIEAYKHFNASDFDGYSKSEN